MVIGDIQYFNILQKQQAQDHQDPLALQDGTEFSLKMSVLDDFCLSDRIPQKSLVIAIFLQNITVVDVPYHHLNLSYLYSDHPVFL